MATYAYDDFWITLTARDADVYDLRASDPSGREYSGSFRVPLTDTELAGVAVDFARGATRRSTPPTAATRDVGTAGPPRLDAEGVGGALAGALFSGEVGVAYETSRRLAASKGHGLRLMLSCAEAPRLLSVPWELLYRRPRFLASQRQTPVVRHLGAVAVPAPPTIDRVVRILGVIASPRDLNPLDVSVERTRVEQATEEMTAIGRVQLDWLEPATPRRLRETLRDGSYHVLHYIGHSDFRADGDGVLYLEDADGAAAEVDSTELANLLGDQTALRLVVLNSCEGARTTATDPYAGVATTLVQLGVPAVVAMQFEISDRAAILFSEELYTNLIGRQDSVDAAVAEARKAIYIELGTAEWATPVLFMGDVDVELFRFEIAAAPLPPPPPGSLAAAVDEGSPPTDAVTPPVTPPSPPRPHRRRRGVAGGIAAVALIALGAVLAVRLGGDDDPNDAAPEPSISVTAAPAGGPGVTAAPAGSATPPLATPAELTGQIDTAGGEARHLVPLAAGQAVYLRGIGDGCSNLTYRLVSPSGAAVGGNPYVCDDAGRLEIAENGEHEVVVESFQGGTGPYELELIPVPADDRRSVAPGGSMTGEISVPGERDVFTFAGAPGDLVYLDGRGACGANVAYELLSPSGTALTGYPYACDDAGRVSLVETGEHTVVVDSWSGGGGAYDIALLPIPADVSTAVSVGDTIAGEITATGEHDAFTFDARAGDVVYLDGRTACGAQVAYRLLSPSDAQLGGNPYVCDDLGPVTIVETGAHTISVESYAGGRGAYEIRLRPG